MHLIEEAFGEGCDLYGDVLNCPRDADKAKLRKAYYRAALKYHPDKNAGDKAASLQFQAVSLAYQILQNDDFRAEYDETGVIPSDEVFDEETTDDKKGGMHHWKNYFDQIFGKVTTSDIDAFKTKYKCSDEERDDVLKQFAANKGNLVKMLEFVMLSEARDASRWVQDYIQPAMESGQANRSYTKTMEKTLKQLEKRVEKENANNDDDDDEETESEDSSDERRPSASNKKKARPKKGKPTKAKKKQKDDNMQDLISQIQNKNRSRGGGAGLLSGLASRYGVNLDDEDPLADEAAFKRAKSRAGSKKRR